MKTELMTTNNTTPVVLDISGVTIPTVDCYKYLGTTFTNDKQNWRKDFKRRKGLAWMRLKEYDWVWDSAGQIPLKRRLCRTIVEPVLLYSVFSYPWTLTVQRTVNGTYHRMMRYALKDAVDFENGTHTATPALLGAEPFMTTLVQHRRFTQVGHWFRDVVATIRLLMSCVLSLLVPACVVGPALAREKL